MGTDWETMDPNDLRTMVYVFDDDKLEKPNCFLQADVNSNVKQSANVVAPWVGYTSDSGAGGRPYQPFQYIRFNMYGAKRLIDRHSAKVMLENPGCYEFSQVENDHTLRWGRWDDDFGASSSDTGAVHGAKTYEMPIDKVTIDGSKCDKVLKSHKKAISSGDVQATCTKSAQSALKTPSSSTFKSPIGHIPSCQCGWYPKMKTQEVVGCGGWGCMGGSKEEVKVPVNSKAYGRSCYNVPGVTVSSPTLQACCCPVL